MSSPTDIIDSFQERLNTALDFHTELMALVHNNRRRSALETMLVEQFVMSSAVLWEAFVNDLLLRYLQEDPSVFLKKQEKSIRDSVKNKFGSTTSRQLKIQRPNTISQATAVAMVDPMGSNITANTPDKLAGRAGYMLTARNAKKFMLSAEDGSLLGFLVAVRNCLSHRSRRSKQSLREAYAVLDVSGANAALSSDRIMPVGSYLKQKDGSGSTRAVLIATRLMKIADQLR